MKFIFKMLTIEKIYKRVKEGPEEKDPYDWEPLRPQHKWILPVFKIEIPRSNNGEKATYEALSKILAFIDIVKRKRFKDGCTVMPISTHSKKYLSIWNSSKGVANAIERMISYGLIEVENDKYRHHAYRDVENYCKTYRYYVDNEVKIIDYCRTNNIEKYVPDLVTKINKKLVEKVSLVAENFDKKQVRFSKKLHIVKPDGLSITEFEEYLTYCLYENYPYLQLIQQKIMEINEYYKTEVEQNFKMDFQPTFQWCEKEGKTNILEGIVIRATNSYSNRKKIKRYWTKKKEELVLEHDVKSSVPRITLSLNLGRWVGENEDIYKLIAKEYEPDHEFTKIRREAIKKLHMWCYFDETSDINLGKNVWRKMKKEGAVKTEVDEVMSKLRKAVIKAEGGKLYGVEIFYVESCLYVMTLYDLLKSGIKTWLVYDAFYSKEFEDKEMFDSMIENGIKLNFEDFIKWHKL